MKKIYIIDTHSMVDLITNSSTELFICDTNKTLDVINEILHSNKELCGYKEPWAFDIKECREWRKKEKELKDNRKDFDFSNIDWEHKFRDIEGWFYDTECEEDLIYLRKHCIEEGVRRYGRSQNYEQYINPYKDRIQEMLIKFKESERWGKGREIVMETLYEEIEESEEKPKWWSNPLPYYPYTCMSANDLNGKVIIIGDNDNSIPYDQFDWISETFNAVSHHLG